MPLFTYRALQADGTVAEGRLQAPGRQEAFRSLDALGLKTVIALGEKSEPAEAAGAVEGGRFRLGARREMFRHIEAFTRQLSNLLSAGVPLSRSLQIVSRESSSPVAREQWRKIHDLVVDGASLAGAMAQSPKTFPKVYVAMVQAGEEGAFLDTVLSQIAEFQAREKELRSKVLTALIYPAVLLVLALAVLIFLLTFFIPRFKLIFAGFGAALPWLTRAIVASSELVTRYGLFVLVALAVGVFLLRQWLETEGGRRRWQRFVLWLPVIGSLHARFAMSRFCRMLGTLTGSGVPLIQALRVARESIGIQVLTDALSSGIERVRQGESLAVSLGDCPELFPGSVLEMVAVAEESGRLDKELVRLGEATEQELDRNLRTAVSLAEPLLLFCMAAFIGTIFVGMVIPIFTLQDYIR